MTQINLAVGKYIVAVSGGIDSVVLLDMIANRQGIELVVAHVDHGIRDDSHLDDDLVRRLAGQYDLTYESVKLDLAGRSDEQSARNARHAWLESVRVKHDAAAIVTAHHRDDVLETMLINLIRGTGWRGLASLRETATYKRPLIDVAKTDIARYAIEHDLVWHEDSTNDDLRYLRNYVRHGVMTRLSLAQKHELQLLYEKQCKMRGMIEADSEQLLELATEGNGDLSRYWLIMVPDGVARELLRQKYGAMTRDQLVRLLHFARTAPRGTKLELSKLLTFRVTPRSLVVHNR
jgi:tRNA(Ile)-lysidine synthetase-like protein